MEVPRLPIGPDEFATGYLRYWDSAGEQFARNFIAIPITLDNKFTTIAAIDTAAVYCVIDPAEAEKLEIDFLGPLERRIAGGKFKGRLGRIIVSIEAIDGKGISVDSTVFVPDYDQGWVGPNLLGLSGFLERIRFAVDPERNHFFFAADTDY